jgi:hypothetical protein
MKGIKFLFVFLIALSTSLTGSSQNEKKSQPASKTSSVEMYYFHFTRRCATCQAVEDVSKNTVSDFYGNKVSFTSLNLEEEGKAKAKELKVSGQTLLIVSGDKKINITNEAFMNTRSNPDKLSTIIKEKIDPLL